MKYKRRENAPVFMAPYIENLLNARGVQDIQGFLNPSRQHLNDPFLLDNMDEGVKLIIDTIQNDQSIGLIVDCDNDGYCSAAMMYLYLVKMNPLCKLTLYFHEHKQHGLEDFVDFFEKEKKHDILILPDASSNDYDFHERLSVLGYKILVIDHHMCESYSNHAIIINNQLSEHYPNKTLSGAGVVYKVCQALDGLTHLNYADELLDLAAVGIIGDVMDLRNLETRYIISQGLKHIKNTMLQAFIEKQSYSIGDTSKITADNIAWYVTPLINAIIRVGTLQEKAVMFQGFVEGWKELPSTKRGHKVGDTETAAAQTARVATNCRNKQNRIKEQVISQIETLIQKNNLNDAQILFIPLEEIDDFPTELTGLVAMTLMNTYKKPVLLGHLNDEGYYRGSARGDNNSEVDNLKSFIEGSGFFEYAEGHANAFGHSISKKQLDNFIQYSNEVLKDVSFNENIYQVDYILNANDDFLDLLLELGEYSEIWGKGVEEPIVVVEDIELLSTDISYMGTNSNSIKFCINGVTYVKFKDDKMCDKLQSTTNMRLTVIGKINLNCWAGNITPQIFIQDYNFTDIQDEF